MQENNKLDIFFEKFYYYINALYIIAFILVFFYFKDWIAIVPSVFMILGYTTCYFTSKTITSYDYFYFVNIGNLFWTIYTIVNVNTLFLNSRIDREDWGLLIPYIIPVILAFISTYKLLFDTFRRYNKLQSNLDFFINFTIISVISIPWMNTLIIRNNLRLHETLALWTYFIIVNSFLSMIFGFGLKKMTLYKGTKNYVIYISSLLIYIIANILCIARVVYSLDILEIELTLYAFYPLMFFYSAKSLAKSKESPVYIGNQIVRRKFLNEFSAFFISIFVILAFFLFKLITTEVFLFCLVLLFITVNLDIKFSEKRLKNEIIKKEHEINSELENKVIEKTKELIESNRELKKQIYSDPLTGLGSAELMIEQSGEMIENGVLEFSLMAFNIDDFKNINNTYGYHVGDLLLVEISNRLKIEFSDKLSYYKLESDEFGVLFSGTSLDEVDTVHKRVDKILREPFVFGDNKFTVNYSISIARYPHDAKSSEEILQRVNIAMFEAKQNRIEKRIIFYSTNFVKEIERRFIMEELVKNAELGRDYKILYRVQHSLNENYKDNITSELTWANPNNPDYNVGEIFRGAEQAGMLKKIISWYLKKTVGDFAKSLEQNLPVGKLIIRISYSSSELIRYISMIVSLCKANNISSSMIEMEIMSDFLHNLYTNYSNIFEVLEKHNISISIKDFGIGFSSLTHLKKCSVEKVVVSESLVEQIDTNEDDLLVVKSIVMIAKGLGIMIQAEGVSRISQYMTLERLGCDFLNGNYLSVAKYGEEFWQTLGDVFERG